ncbi:ATP-dependent DNA helicase [bacterium]|nr:ATP-dependent DNA helicase [bacterium]
MNGNYQRHFPHSQIRESQKHAIEKILEAYDNGKRFVILEAGTGVGKSAIGLTVARHLNAGTAASEKYEAGSWFVTTQKILQEQYVKDFGKPTGEMCSIKSSTNYMCSFHKKNTCSQSQQLLRTEDKSSRFFKACTFKCNYKESKKSYLETQESVTNFPYFMTEAAYSGKITPRNFLVVDEAHNIETELSRFVEVSVSDRFVKAVLKTSLPRGLTQFQAFKWIKDVYFPKAKAQLNHMEKQIDKIDLTKKMKELQTISRQYDMLRGHVSKLENFLSFYSKDNWIFDEEKSWEKKTRKFVFKSIDVSKFANDYLFRLGSKVLMMSATILDHDVFCQSLGVPRSAVEFIRIPSPFPIKNRPIFTASVGSMSTKNLEKTLPRLLNAVKEILDNHSTEKGIIHCHTYRIAKFLKQNLSASKYKTRVLIHDSTNRDEVLQKHISSKKPTVLLSPSMTEGVDLRGEFSRFQVICKVPYPYLGDKLVKKRMHKWKTWYPLQTAKSVVQSVGRSVRSKDDFAVSYILDSDFDRFYSMNRKLFPEDFKKCINRL